MREITKLMIRKYQLLQLKYDFMGYGFENKKELTFHHLIVPHRLCRARRIKNDGFIESNGAIIQKDAHDYLHIIENYDGDIYEYITAEMVDENLKGYLDMKNIRVINDVLNIFEKEYGDATTKAGQPLIKEKYKQRILKK